MTLPACCAGINTATPTASIRSWKVRRWWRRFLRDCRSGAAVWNASHGWRRYTLTIVQAHLLFQYGKIRDEPQGIAVHHGTRQHCNDAELLRPRYFPFRTGGNGTAASQGKNHRRGQAGACGRKRRGKQGGISSTQNLLLLLLLLRAKT